VVTRKVDQTQEGNKEPRGSVEGRVKNKDTPDLGENLTTNSGSQ